MLTDVTDELVQLVRQYLCKGMPQEPLAVHVQQVLAKCAWRPTWNTWQFMVRKLMVRKLVVGLRLPCRFLLFP